MKDCYKLADAESRFADIIWANEPISSTELVKPCEKELSWKKSTTYTVLKKLIGKGIFQNEKSIVSAKLTKEQFYGLQSQNYVTETFGSLPRFLTAFFQGRKLSHKEVEELRSYIDSFEE